MSDMDLLLQPARVKRVVRRRSTSEARGAIGAVVVTVATINDALEQLEGAAGEHSALHAELVEAVTVALARVPNVEAKGLTLGRVDGKERLVVDTETLAATLWKDPHALDALLSGDDGLSDLSATLNAGTDAAVAAATEPPEPQPMESARILAQMRTLQVLDSLPSTSRHRLELLV